MMHRGNRLRNAILMILCIIGLVLHNPRPAQALCDPCTDGGCPMQIHTSDIWPHIMAEHARTLATFALRLAQHALWFTAFYFTHVEPMIEGMAHQMTNVIAHQTNVIGQFFDASQQLETQRLMQKLTAQAHKDYHPSYGMCTFGTAVRSLASADARASVTKSVLDERSVKRQLGSMGGSASAGPGIDRIARLDQFKGRFCDMYDNNHIVGTPATGLELVCNAAVANRTLNKDVDFYRTVSMNRSISLDVFNGGVDTEDPEIFALASNLYAHEPLKQMTSSLLQAGKTGNRDLYQDLRSIVAKRSLAESSFNTIVAMKAMGAPASAVGAGAAATRPYMEALLDELGMNAGEASAFLGERPGYLAQMEILAKKIYQRQSFYIDLYDKPANIERKQAAMQAIGLMIDRDIYNSHLRNEAMMSMLLELKLIPAQEAVENNAGKLRVPR